MAQAFTRNYQDDSTDAGYQFTFYCDICNDGYKSRFIENESFKKGRNLRGMSQGLGALGSFVGGRVASLGWSAERGTSALSERFQGQTPQWYKDHEAAFEQAQGEMKEHFLRCHGCNKYVCTSCMNEDEGLCTECAPRQEIYVAKAKAEAMRRNVDAAGETATVWQGEITSKTTVCPSCGKPAGSGKFCNNCGYSMALNVCPTCGEENAQSVKFCNNCGTNLKVQMEKAICTSCGVENPPGTKFCGECGTKLS